MDNRTTLRVTWFSLWSIDYEFLDNFCVCVTKVHIGLYYKHKSFIKVNQEGLLTTCLCIKNLEILLKAVDKPGFENYRKKWKSSTEK